MITIKTYDYRLKGPRFSYPSVIDPATIKVIGSAELNKAMVSSTEPIGHDLHMVYMIGSSKRYAIDSEDLKLLKEA